MRKSGWAGVAVAALTLASGTVVACQPFDRSSDTDTGAIMKPPPKVSVVGDSLTHQAAPPISERLQKAGFAYTVASKPGQDLRSDFIRGALDDAQLRPVDVLVVATAANDAVTVAEKTTSQGRYAAIAAYRTSIEAIVTRFRESCVVVVNSRENVSGTYNPDQVFSVDTVLAELVQLKSNMVLVDWNAVSKPMPAAWFATDRLHFGQDPDADSNMLPSAGAYADAILEGINRCARS